MSNASDFIITELELPWAKIPYLQKYEGAGGEVKIPEGVVLISSSAFTFAKNITSIEIPSTVTEIDDLTFYLQRNLKSVTIPDSVEEMGVDAFAECTALTEVIVSDQFIAKMWRYCHADLKLGVCCTYLRSKERFSEESAKRLTTFIRKNKQAMLQRICVDDDVAVIQAFLALEKKVSPAQIDEYLAAAEGKPALTAYLLDYKMGTFSEKQISTSVSEEADKLLGLKAKSVSDWRKMFKFKVADGIATISGYKGEDSELTIPGKIGSNSVIIGESAFDNNRCLKKVTIESGVVSIGANAFCACVNINEITIEDGLQKIGFGAFQGCRGLERVFLPQSVNEIGNDVFWCSNDITIYAPAGSYAETYAKENNISFVAV